jgi:RNA polymerase sigma factor FliA
MAVAETAELWLARQSVCEPAEDGTLEQAVNESLAGVKFLAGRLANRLPAHVDVEDLVQVGLLGLLQCAQRFDSQRGVKFQTYANRRVQGAMLDYLRSLDWRPRSVRKRSRRLAQAVAAVEQRTGESAQQEDLAAEMGISSPELRRWVEDYSSRGEHAVISCFGRGFDENSEDLLALIADPADSPETKVEKTELRSQLAQAIERLPENERAVCSLYYFEQRTMKEIGRRLGVKQARVSQLHAQALRRLRMRMRREARIQAPPATPAPTTETPVPAPGCALIRPVSAPQPEISVQPSRLGSCDEGRAA